MQTGCQVRIQGKLTPERVRTSSDWPKLKVNGAACRHLGAWALDLCLRFAKVDSLDAFTAAHDEVAIGVCQLLVELNQILSSESMFLSEQARNRIPELGNQLASLYSRLASLCFDHRPPLRLWKLSPKLHLLRRSISYPRKSSLLVDLRGRGYGTADDPDCGRRPPQDFGCLCNGEVVVVCV